MSPSVNAEPGKLYAYGNFCGEGRPFAEFDANNFDRIQAISAKDDIDLVCKFHDLCYAKFGADAYACDTFLPAIDDPYDFLDPHFDPVDSNWPEDPHAPMACYAQYAEVTYSLNFLKQNRELSADVWLRNSASAILTPITVATMCVTTSISRYPEDGSCRLKPSRREALLADLSQVLAAAYAIDECGGATEILRQSNKGCVTEERINELHRALSIEQFLGLN